MADAIEVYLDISTPQGGLFKSLTDRTVLALGPFYQGAALNFRVFPVVPTGATLGALFAKVPLAGLSFEMVVGIRTGTNQIYAAQYVWTAQNANDAEGKSGYWYATLDLNTTELNAAITGETLTCYLEFRLKRGAGSFGPVCQQQISVVAAVKDPSGAASIPTPAPSYLTRDECLALFVAWNNAIIPANAGRTLVLSSPDATKTRELGVANDGAAIDNAG